MIGYLCREIKDEQNKCTQIPWVEDIKRITWKQIGKGALPWGIKGMHI